jgi:hypothetical protein
MQGKAASAASGSPNLRDAQRYLALAWHLSTRWWVLLLSFVVLLAATFGALWLGKDIVVGGTKGDPYLLREFLVDGADVALKLGAVGAGILGVYRYWYHRYEPLVYFVACSPCTLTLLEDLRRDNPAFAKICERLDLPAQPLAEDWERVHDLPLIVFHETSRKSLGVSEGSMVDLRFETPDGNVIWSTGFAFTFESIKEARAEYSEWPVALSLSLRRYFRIERPFHDFFSGEDRREQEPPEGWQRVEVYYPGYARLHGTTQHGTKLLWIASDSYSVRFRDPIGRDRFHHRDDPGEFRVLEYVGIALRVYRRSGLRYRGQE